MADAGTSYTDSAVRAMERRFRSIYRQAQKEIIGKLDEHTKALNAQDEVKRAKVENGELSPEAYKRWLNGQVFTGKQWKDKVDSVATSLLYANQQANDIVEGKKRAVFGENATYQAYSLEHDAGMDLSFSIYDSTTVTRLIKEQPELLPRKVVNGVKDKAWNRTKISNCVTQGIIQGESIPQIAQRIAKSVSSDNMSAMTRYARTAMTGAQNAGRMEMLHEAQEMGIKVKKKWLATLDNRTRDAHQDLDGQTVDVDEPFRSSLGPIDYPGDFHADPANVWCCRCTLIYEYPEYKPQNAQRRAYNDLDSRESELISDMTYNEWKAYKAAGGGNALVIEEPAKITPRFADFVSASSIQEAEEYAGQFLRKGGKVSYKNIDLEYANACNKVLSDIRENYDIDGLYSIQAMNTREKLWKTSTADAAYRWGMGDLYINPKYYKTQSLFRQHTTEIDGLMQTVLNGGQALIDSGRATGRKKDYIEALLRTGRQCVAQSHDFAQATIVHECGHMLDDKIFRREISSAFGGTNITGASLLAESRAKFGGGISGYAIQDNQEYVAESFTAWWFGEGDKCDPTIVGVFERMMKK